KKTTSKRVKAGENKACRIKPPSRIHPSGKLLFRHSFNIDGEMGGAPLAEA
ncbi:unnamed protein product, partial [Rotaria sp. Silwood2]